MKGGGWPPATAASREQGRERDAAVSSRAQGGVPTERAGRGRSGQGEAEKDGEGSTLPRACVTGERLELAGMCGRAALCPDAGQRTSRVATVISSSSAAVMSRTRSFMTVLLGRAVRLMRPPGPVFVWLPGSCSAAHAVRRAAPAIRSVGPLRLRRTGMPRPPRGRDRLLQSRAGPSGQDRVPCGRHW